MTDLPTPAGAMQAALNYFTEGDRDGARFWLDFARELRCGQRPVARTTPMNDPPAPAESDSTMRVIPGYNESDAAAMTAVATDGDCPSCGKPIFFGELGQAFHRSTYSTECEFATVGR